MAVMIPSAISPEVKSTAEKRIYEWFATAPGTEDWIVLHSLGIANHNKYIHAEVDFFVIAPGLGIFALEVKGGRVKRSNGIWSFTDKYGHTDTRVTGPFDQAWNGIYSIIKSLSKKLDENHRNLEKIFFGIGVMFPDISYDSVGIDEEQWQVFDCNDQNRVKNFVERVAEGSKRGWITQYGVLTNKNLPSREDARYLANILRGDFDKKPSLRASYNNVESEQVVLTDNQYRCIDQLEDNPRCLIKGAAGTGKTLLAVEEVKKYASRGERVALICYNKLLGAWLQNRFVDLNEKGQPVYVGTLHRLMIDVLQKKNHGIDFPASTEDAEIFFSKILPKMATDALSKESALFDRIIIDEAQDILSEEYIDFLDLTLKRGLERGKWSLFGDFERQAIYSPDKDEIMFLELLEEKASFIRYKLIENCRNTKNICKEIKVVTGFSKDSKYDGIVTGPRVEYITYRNQEEEADKLVNIIKNLSENHVERGRITILSPRRKENSAVKYLKGIKIQDFSVGKQDEISFCTIQGFKGMENSVIILTDIETYEDVRLMYVAFSRARSGLYVLESERAKTEYDSLFIRRYLLNG